MPPASVAPLRADAYHGAIEAVGENPCQFTSRRAREASDKDGVKGVHAQFIDKGGRFYVCPICFNERDLDQQQLVEGAELKGATPLMEFAGDGATTFNY